MNRQCAVHEARVRSHDTADKTGSRDTAWSHLAIARGLILCWRSYREGKSTLCNCYSCRMCCVVPAGNLKRSKLRWQLLPDISNNIRLNVVCLPVAVHVLEPVLWRSTASRPLLCILRSPGSSNRRRLRYTLRTCSICCA